MEEKWKRKGIMKGAKMNNGRKMKKKEKEGLTGKKKRRKMNKKWETEEKE